MRSIECCVIGDSEDEDEDENEDEDAVISCMKSL